MKPNAPLIAHVVFRFDIGGLENGLANLLNRLPRERYRHAVVALTEVSGFAARVVRDDVHFIELKKGPGHGLALWPRLTMLFRQLRPSVVHTRNIAALEATLPAAVAGVAVRLHGEHGLDVGGIENWRYRWTRRAYRPFVSKYVALSGEIENYLAEAVRVPRSRIVRIVNGVDTQRFCPRGGTREPISGSPFNDPRLWLVGTVGRLVVVKNQIALVRAFARMVEARGELGRNFRLVIVGEGPLRPVLEREVSATGLGDRVWFAGARDDVHDVLRGLDCFALPSISEGISNTVLEAMACGLPIVATDVGGNSELLDDGISGRLVALDDLGALAAAIGGIIDDAVMARRLGDAARREAVARFSLDRMVDEYAAVYDRCLAQRAPVALSAASF